MEAAQKPQQSQELDPGQYIGTDGEVHEESDMSGAECSQCGYEVGPDGYCEECSSDENC